MLTMRRWFQVIGMNMENLPCRVFCRRRQKNQHMQRNGLNLILRLLRRNGFLLRKNWLSSRKTQSLTFKRSQQDQWSFTSHQRMLLHLMLSKLKSLLIPTSRKQRSFPNLTLIKLRRSRSHMLGKL
uniref:Uncharacterized protein n=1 Tax=Arundo donax TaxID=35708 RepID=A0A0A9CY98_ARUDO